MKKLLTYIKQNGIVSAHDLATALGVSQQSISRYIRANDQSIARLGQGSGARYGLHESILGLPSLLPLYWVDENGSALHFANLQHLSGGALYIESVNDAANKTVTGRQREEFFGMQGVVLPWWLCTLELQGYVGRQRINNLVARQPLLPGNLEQWRSTHHLYAHTSGSVDARGAILVGEQACEVWTSAANQAGIANDELLKQFDQLASDEGHRAPGRSSVDGEQAKFIVKVQRTANSDESNLGEPYPAECIVKFSPPRGTPFGERWNDLLTSEFIAGEVLRRAGYGVPSNRLLKSASRTYLESERIDRVGRAGRRHLLPLSAIQQKFLPSQSSSWSDIARGLVRQKRLPQASVGHIDTLRAFGHCIGNTDMHNGNCSVLVANPESLWAGRFGLAPVYDMLAMRWAPRFGMAPDYNWFDHQSLVRFIPESSRNQGIKLGIAFWQLVILADDISSEFRTLAVDAHRALIAASA